MSDIDKNIVSEPKPEWGGDWTEKKLNVFSKYVSAYLTIMSKHTYWKTIYFDGFAGSGKRNNKKSTKIYNQLFQSNEENEGYKGAAERVLLLKNNLAFDFHYFIDANEDSLAKLKIKLSKLQDKHKEKFQFKSGDCNDHILQLSQAMKTNPNKFASLVFIDPFGMQINWDSIASLKKTRTDIWILVPTGVIINRLLDRKGELTHLKKLESFFGLNEDEIREFFYKSKTRETLFGEEIITTKIREPIEKIAALYAERLKTIWKYVTKKPLVLMNSRSVPIFHFVFASNNASALGIAKDIIK